MSTATAVSTGSWPTRGGDHAATRPCQLLYPCAQLRHAACSPGETRLPLRECMRISSWSWRGAPAMQWSAQWWWDRVPATREAMASGAAVPPRQTQRSAPPTAWCARPEPSLLRTSWCTKRTRKWNQPDDADGGTIGCPWKVSLAQYFRHCLNIFNNDGISEGHPSFWQIRTMSNSQPGAVGGDWAC